VKTNRKDHKLLSRHKISWIKYIVLSVAFNRARIYLQEMGFCCGRKWRV